MMVRIPARDGGEFSAYLTTPLKGKGPAVVVLEDGDPRKICDWLASRQITALCPELVKTNDDQSADEVGFCIEFLRKHETCTGRVGVVGYGWGGLIAYLTAVRHRPDAAVCYYGVGIEKKLDLAKDLSCHMLMHYGAPAEVVEQVRTAFQDDLRVTVREYPAATADLADMRTLAFFIERLVGAR